MKFVKIANPLLGLPAAGAALATGAAEVGLAGAAESALSAAQVKALQDAFGGGSDFWQNWNPTLNTNVGAYLATSSNDVWAFLSFSRSTGAGTTSVKVKALNIYIQEIN